MEQDHKDQEHQERIRQRAHEIWESEGRPHGRDADHWSRAEQELRNRMGEDQQKEGDHQPELARMSDPQPKPRRKAAPRKTAKKEPADGASSKGKDA